MAIITNFATLSTAVGDYLNRSDLTTFVPNFIQGCEAKLYKNLRIRAMETALSVTISSGVAAIPSDYVELKFAYVDASPIQPLKRASMEEIYTLYPTRSGGEKPRLISTEGTNFIFGPYPGNYTIKGTYYARLAALSGSNTTNWFTTNSPTLLLYGSLLEAEPFLMGDERMLTWRALYDAEFMAVAREETRQKSSGSGLQTRVM
jgi:hypothetical protein